MEALCQRARFCMNFLVSLCAIWTAVFMLIVMIIYTILFMSAVYGSIISSLGDFMWSIAHLKFDQSSLDKIKSFAPVWGIPAYINRMHVEIKARSPYRLTRKIIHFLPSAWIGLVSSICHNLQLWIKYFIHM